MNGVCLLHYAWFMLCSLIGGGLGSFLVLRFWVRGELDVRGGDGNGNETR